MKNYHLLLLAVFFCSFVSLSFGQSEFKATLLGGLSSTQVQGDSYGGFDKMGILGGAEVSIDFSERWNVSLGMLYINKGSRKVPNTKDGDFETFRLVLNYIDLPLMARFRIDNFQVQAGINPGVLVSSSEEFNGVNYGEPNVPLKQLDVSWIIGGRFNFSQKLAADVRYTTSLLPIDEPRENVSLTYPNRMYNWGIQVMLAYTL